MIRKIDFRKEILPHILAVAVFFLIILFLYHPIFLENKDIRMNDVLQGIGGGQESSEFRKLNDEEALWTNSMFGGMPSYLINIRWSGDLLEYLQKVMTLGLPSPASVTFLMMINFYVMLLIFRIRPVLALAGSIAFALASFNIISIEAGHIWKARAVAYMPLVVAGFHLMFEKEGRKIAGFLLIAFGLAFEIKANHLQITYYLALMLAVFGIHVLVNAIRHKNVKAFLQNTIIMVIAVLFALGCNLGRLWSSYEYGSYSTRGKSDLIIEKEKSTAGLDKDYVFAWSSGVFESLTLLIPNFYGGASGQPLDDDSNLANVLRRNNIPPQQINQNIQYARTYWGDQPFTSGPYYAGAIIIFLFVLGLFVVETKHRYWLLGATILSLMLSWGKNFETFNFFMYDYFPGYDKFRAVSMAVIIATLTMPLLGFLALEKLWADGFTKKHQKNILIAGAITAGFCLLSALLAGIGSYAAPVDQALGAPDWYIEALRADRQAILRSDAIRSLIFIVLSGVVIFLYLKKKTSPYLSLALLTVLIFIDLIMVDKRYLNKENFVKNSKNQFFQVTAADKKIKSDTGEFRTLNLVNTWQDGRTSYHHHSIGGYHGAKMKRYQELIDHCLGNEVNSIIEQLRGGASASLQGISVINMLNTRYFVYGPNANQVIFNGGSNGNAWLATNILKVNSANEALDATCNLQDPYHAIIDVSRFEVNNDTANGSVKLTSYAPNHLVYESNSDAPAVALFSEIYYPSGWNAWIDGEKTDIKRANYILRALEIPSGKHEIVFKFEPNSYYVGNKVMMASSALLIILLLGSIVLPMVKKKDD